MREGYVIGERFVIEREIASGGMGTVYRAVDRDRSAAVALKVMIGQHTEAAARFQREAETLAEIDHPSIVRYVAHGVAPNGPWLAMEWLDGEDLASCLSRGTLSIDRAVSFARRIAQALGALHRRGLVHRDVKPSNIFLVEGDPGRAKLLDLGVARRIREADALTGTGIAIGTPYYMAPEQARAARDLDARVDVFALGAVLYEAIAGVPPFHGQNLVEVLAKIVLEPSPSLGARVPRSLDAIVARCLAKPREERFADGGALADALASSFDDVPATSGSRTLGVAERRVVTVVLIGRADPLAATMAVVDAGEVYPRVQAAIASRGGKGERLVDGSVIVALSESAVPTDQAVAAARIAAAVRAAVPELPLAIATGRAELTGNAPIGEAVARAVKALAVARAGAIRLDEDAASLLAARYAIERDEHGAILVGERAGEGAARLLLGRVTPFVGRDREVSVLEGLFRECAEEPIARAALVTAPAGSGKSRLRDEFVTRLQHAEERPEIFTGVADVLRAGAPFAILSSALRRSGGIYDGEPIEVQREKLRARVARSVKPEVARHALPFLGEMCGVAFSDEDDDTLRAARRDPSMMADHVRVAFEELLAAECEAHPVLLVLDDLHWGDLPSVRVIDAALRTLHDRRLFVLALARPEIHDLFPRLFHDRQLQEVRLGALSKRACEKLIRESLPAASDEIVAWIVERAQGNAFFVEELIRAIAARGTRGIPDTVLGVVQARLDTLGGDAKRALRAASVFGETFWRGGVREVVGDDPALDGALRDLVEREVVNESPGARFPGEEALVFRHALIRDAAYATLTDHDRALAHLRARDWLEARGDLDPVELAGHAERGGDRASAATWWARAADGALEVNDLANAVDRAERGVACGASGALLAHLRLTQTIATMWQGDHAAALQHAEQALAEATPGSAVWFRAAAEGNAASGRLGVGEDMAHRFERLLHADANADAIDEQVIALCRAFVPASNAGLSVARQVLERAVVVAAERTLGPIARAQLREAQGLDWAMRGAPEQGESCLLEAISAYAEGGAARDQSLTMTSLAWIYLSAGNLVRAEATIDRALAMASSMRIQQGLAWAMQMRGMILVHRERRTEALPLLMQAAETFHHQRNARQEGWTLSALSRARLELGDGEGAYRDATRAIELLASNPVLIHWALAARARASLQLGALDDAVVDAKRAVENLRVLPWKLDRGVTYRALGEVLLARREESAANEAIATAAAELRAIAEGLRDDEWRAQFLAMPDHAWILSHARA